MAADRKSLSELRRDFESEVLKNQIYSYKYNLIFSGIPGEEITRADTRDMLVSFMINKLHIHEHNARGFYFADIHRLGKKQNGRPRNIIAKFTNMIDRDYVLNMGKNLKDYKTTKVTEDGHHITYQTYRISEHLPPQLVEQKNELWPEYKRAAGQRRQFRVIGSSIYLFVNGHKFNANRTKVTRNGRQSNTRQNGQKQQVRSIPSKNSTSTSTRASDDNSLNSATMEIDDDHNSAFIARSPDRSRDDHHTSNLSTEAEGSPSNISQTY